MLNSEWLETFVEVVRRGGVTAASHALHLSQPAISRQIKQLEAHLGLSLFERTGRGLMPTSGGQRLYERARPLLLELEGLGDELDHGPIRGKVSLGMSPSIGAVWTAGLIQAIRQRLPEIELRVVSMLSGALGSAVARGTLDLGMLYSPTLGLGLSTRDLWEESSYLVVSKRSGLCDQRSISLRRALGQCFILPSSRFGLRNLLEERSRELELPLQVALEVDSVQLALALVERDQGAMILTERALSDIGQRDLVWIPIRGVELRRSAQLVSVDSALRREAVRAVWAVCEESAQARRGGGG